MSSRVLGCEEKLYFRTLEVTATPNNLANQVKQSTAVVVIVEDKAPTFEAVLRQLSSCVCFVGVG